MSIMKVAPPAASGRQPRLTDEDVTALAKEIKAGNWASDGQSVPTKSAAYQRAQTAVKLLGERFKLTNVKTSACPVNPEDPNTKYNWSVGPRPEGEKPRRTPRPKAA